MNAVLPAGLPGACSFSGLRLRVSSALEVAAAPEIGAALKTE
jgi:hypothetical protein